MANRILLSAVVTLALILSPAISQAVPTKTTKKKSSKTQSKVSKTCKSGKKSKYSRRSSSRQVDPEAVEAGMVAAPSRGSRSVAETPPLMKVTPQRDGRFMLEPLSPKKPATPITRPSSQPDLGRDQTLREPPKHHKFEPWNFNDLVLTMAKHYQDTPYARGGNLASGYATDCSGFVQYIYQGFKISLPRSSAEQAQVGKVIARDMDFSKLLPGDLLFFRRGGRSIGHAGIYLGEGKMIHASNRRLGVTITDLRQPYYEGTFVVAKRVFEVQYQY
jgi:cell wall-associated NlpC family hydrolase